MPRISIRSPRARARKGPVRPVQYISYRTAYSTQRQAGAHERWGCWWLTLAPQNFPSFHLDPFTENEFGHFRTVLYLGTYLHVGQRERTKERRSPYSASYTQSHGNARISARLAHSLLVFFLYVLSSLSPACSAYLQRSRSYPEEVRGNQRNQRNGIESSQR
jgi:hypothetical protein